MFFQKLKKNIEKITSIVIQLLKIHLITRIFLIFSNLSALDNHLVIIL